MPKRASNTILIASVLKPWDDHRMYEKWALFFLRNYSCNIHIFGREISFETPNSIYFHTSLKKNSIFSRIQALISFLKVLFKTKPDLVVLTSFDLLLPSFFYWIFTFGKTKFLYDVIENYRLNWKNQLRKNVVSKLLVQLFIRFNEFLAPFFIKTFFYSDAIYQSQLPFLLGKNSILLENLFSYPHPINFPSLENTYLITGTISKAYGIELAFSWIREIKKNHPNASIKLLGHLTDKFIIPDDIKNLCQIELSEIPISHKRILEEIAQAEYLLLAYNWTESFVGCTPAKLYEAIYLKTKVICSYEENLANKLSHPLLHLIPEKSDSTNIHQEKKEPLRFEEAYYETLKTKLNAYLE